MSALNYADKIAIGGQQASAVYIGGNRVWPVFKPTDIAGCRVWLDASKLNLADGANVTAWTNLGGGPQPVITGTPKYRTNAVNTVMPVVRFNRGSGKLRMAGTGVDKDYTIIYVGRKWSLASTYGRIVTAHGSAANILIGYHMQEGDVCYVEGWLTNPSGPPATTLWKLYSADSTSTGVARFFKDGWLQASGTATPASGWGGTLNISGYVDDPDINVAQECDCEIAELVQFNRKLSDVERGQIERYLREKWMAPWWTPSNLGGNLTAWFDSSDFGTVITVGSGVHRWWTKAGVMEVTQAVDDTYRPPYLGSGGVNFTLNKGMNASNGPAAFDVIVVAKPNPFAPDPVNWRTMLRSVGAHEIILEMGSNRLGVYNAGFFPAGGLTWPAVDGMCFARVAPNATLVMSRDGGVLTSTGSVLPATSAATTMFGCYMGAPPTQGFGLVKEVIYVPYGLDSERQRLEGYVAHKWGLSPLLPADHPYKNAPPLNKV